MVESLRQILQQQVKGKKHAKYYSFMVNYANWLK